MSLEVVSRYAQRVARFLLTAIRYALMDVATQFAQAVSCFQQGDLAGAQALSEGILAVQPGHADANFLLGIIAAQGGRLASACPLFERAIYSSPGQPQYHYNYGLALQRGGRLEAALTAYTEATRLQPGYLEAHNNRGAVLRVLGRPAEALAAYGTVIRLNPDMVEAHHFRGTLLRQLDRHAEALAAYEQVIRLTPDLAEAHNNRGAVLRDLGRLQEALQSFGRAIQLKPDLAAAYSNCAQVLFALDRMEEALVACERAVALKPDFIAAHTIRGNTLFALNHLGDALAAYHMALQLDPLSASHHYSIGGVLAGLGCSKEAEDSFRQALALKPDDALIHSNLVFLLAARASLPPDDMLVELRRWDQVHGQAGRLYPLLARTPENAIKRRLRVGYLSTDLRRHAVSYFFEPLLAGHNFSSVEIFCYDVNEKAPDATTNSLQGLADHWRRVGDKTDAELASLIHADHIDILVDLVGHTGGNWLKVFTYRPAPVQATYLGFFASTGLEAMDYWITDAVLHPPDTTEPSVERIVRLPRCWVCYQPPAEAPPVSPCPNTDERVVFGSFSNLSKLTPAVIRTWAELLRRLPGSRLLLMDKPLVEARTRRRLAERFVHEGISAEQLMLRAGVPFMHYLATYAEVDIVLDPFPRTGGTVTAEALWMGVPVVTLAGRYYVERISASKLTALGLEDLITRSQEEYLDRAVSLARDPGRREVLRTGLRERMRQSPLCDGKELAEAMEVAYRTMWEQYVSAYQRT